jgi:hypothetical protein
MYVIGARLVDSRSVSNLEWKSMVSKQFCCVCQVLGCWAGMCVFSTEYHQYSHACHVMYSHVWLSCGSPGPKSWITLCTPLCIVNILCQSIFHYYC